MNKNSKILAIGFASLCHTLCHLLTLLFTTVILVLDEEINLSFKQLAELAVPVSFLFSAGYLPEGSLGDRFSKTGLLEIYFTYCKGQFSIFSCHFSAP